MNTNLCELLDDPTRRRFWLLIKALENAPLREALALAKATEAFVTERAVVSQERAVAYRPTVYRPSTRIH
jgi:hypothetical protein